MIDLQSIRKMAKATENGKHYISPMKNKSEGGSGGSRYNSLVASSRKAGVKLSGSLKTKAGFEEWVSRFPEELLGSNYCITCRLWDPEEKVLDEHTGWIIPRVFLNYISIYRRRYSNIAGVSFDKSGRYKTARKGKYVGTFDTALEAHNHWLFYSVDVFSDLLKEHEAILDLVSIARVKEIQESFRSFAENNSVMKQIPASQLDREVLKQQYFNSLKGNQS